MKSINFVYWNLFLLIFEMLNFENHLQEIAIDYNLNHATFFH
jgi:hypothetical protein